MSALDERGLPLGYPFNTEWEITPRDFLAMRERGDTVLLLDVRTSQERMTACIAGSIHIPLTELDARLEELRVHDENIIVVKCHHGARGLRAVAALRRAGFDHAFSLAGGIHLWSIDIDPSTPIY